MKRFFVLLAKWVLRIKAEKRSSILQTLDIMMRRVGHRSRGKWGGYTTS